MRVSKNKEYAINIYSTNGEWWDYRHIKRCIVRHAKNIDDVLILAHKQLPTRIGTHKHTPASFYYQVCDTETSEIGRYIFRNGRAKKIA